LELPDDVIKEFETLPETHRIYYDDAYTKEFDSEVLGVKDLGQYTYIVLKSTAFYPEGGGQEGDQGLLETLNAKYEVIDTQTIEERVVVHICEKLKGNISVGDKVHGKINWDLRYSRMRHHTGSHVVFASAREILGVKRLIYMGVYVGDKWGRIDINYDNPISDEEILNIERLANQIILENRPVKIKFMKREEAERIYGDKLGVTEVTPTGIVRVVEIEDFDAGLCGGTHVKSTIEIGLVRIIEHYKLAKGIHRIRFAAGLSAYQGIYDLIVKLHHIARTLNSSPDEADIKVESLLRKKNELEKRITRLKKRFAKYEAKELLEKAIKVNDIIVLVDELRDAEPDYMQLLIRRILSSHAEAVVILGTRNEKAFIFGGAGDKAIKRGVKINTLVEEIKSILDGKGGGSPRRIQVVGTIKHKIEEALELARKKIMETLKS